MPKQSTGSQPKTGSGIQDPAEWLRLFEDEGVQFIILDTHADAELAQAVRARPAWSLHSEDEELVIFAPTKME
jgi:hypothetical protein